jgi:hypothetical protein
MPSEYFNSDQSRDARIQLCDLAGLEIRDCEVNGLRIVDCYGADVSLGGDVERLGDAQPVEAEQDGERCMVAVEAFGGEQEHAELAAIQTPRVGSSRYASSVRPL